MIFRVFFVLFILTFPALSQARVFDFSSESIAPYLNMRTGMSSMGNDPYYYETPSGFGGDDVGLMYGGEFGIYMRGGGFGLSLGMLVHTLDPVTGGTAANASGTQLYSVDSEGIAYGGLINFDYQLSQTNTYNWKFSVGGGYEFLKVENTYSVSATGQPLVGGQSSFVESFKTAAPFITAGVGTEFLLSGTTTMNISMGYHYSMADTWKYGQGGQNFAGTHGQGDDAVLESGVSREINWSYPFLQIGFQFYVDTIR